MPDPNPPARACMLLILKLVGVGGTCPDTILLTDIPLSLCPCPLLPLPPPRPDEDVRPCGRLGSTIGENVNDEEEEEAAVVAKLGNRPGI